MQTVIHYLMMFFTGTLLQAQAGIDRSQIPSQIPSQKEVIIASETCRASTPISVSFLKDETSWSLFGERTVFVKNVYPYKSFQ